MKRFAVGFAAFVMLALSLCGKPAASGAKVAVSLPPQAWLVDKISDGRLSAVVALPQGVDPHEFEPTPRLIKELSEAERYLSIGMVFEDRLTNALARLSGKMRFFANDRGVVKMGGGCRHGHGHSCHGSGGDPHIWLSPAHFATMASNTACALSGMLPREEVEVALAKTVAEIRQVDWRIKNMLFSGNAGVLLAYHPSYSYFAAHYGLKTMDIEQEGKAPSAKRMAEVIRSARASGVKRVIVDRLRPRRPAEVVAGAIGAKLVEIDPLQRDWVAVMEALAHAAGR